MSMDETISQRAFSVYCDHAAREAVNKNASLRKENNDMEHMRNLLTHMKIYNGRHELLAINLEKLDDGLVTNSVSGRLLYEVDSSSGKDIEFPSTDIPRLHCVISNVYLEGGNGLSCTVETPPQLRVHYDGTVQLEFHASKDVIITGTLKNYAGSLCDVMRMGVAGRFATQFTTMMGFAPDTRATASIDQEAFDHSLDGATFSLESVEISKRIIHPIVFGRLGEPEEDVEAKDEEELHVLSQVNKLHKGLCKAFLERQELEARNRLLNESHELFRTVTALYLYGSITRTIRFRLECGKSDHMSFYAGQQQPAWSIDPDRGEPNTGIPLSAISEMRFQLANIPWSCQAGPGSFRPLMFTERNEQMVVLYGPHIEARFCFEKDVDKEESFPGDWFRQYVTWAFYDPWQYQRGNGPKFTMRLMHIRILKLFIQTHMDAFDDQLLDDEE